MRSEMCIYKTLVCTNHAHNDGPKDWSLGEKSQVVAFLTCIVFCMAAVGPVDRIINRRMRAFPSHDMKLIRQDRSAVNQNAISYRAGQGTDRRDMPEPQLPTRVRGHSQSGAITNW